MSINITNSKILILSSQSSLRMGLKKTFLDLGANQKDVVYVKDYMSAMEEFNRESYSIVISDDNTVQKSALEFLDFFVKKVPNSLERIFILMPANVSPFLLAKFTYEGGDIVVPKPFNNDIFIKELQSFIAAREKMNADSKLAFQIQDQVRLGKIEDAKLLLANFQNTTSFQSYSSHALIHEILGEKEAAFQAYNSALEVKVDFRSLVALIRLGSELKKFDIIIDYIELWLAQFPLHPDYLTEISKTVVLNQRYDFLDQFAAILDQNKITDEFARIPLAAGCVLAGSHYLKSDNPELAKKYSALALENACGKKQIIYSALEITRELSGPVEVEKKYVSLNFDLSTNEGKIFDVKLKDLFMQKEKIVSECNKLIASKIIHPDVYSIMIRNLKLLGKDPHEIFLQAKKNFPNYPFDT